MKFNCCFGWRLRGNLIFALLTLLLMPILVSAQSVSSISLDNYQPTCGLNPAIKATVTIASPTAKAATVKLSSSNPAVASLPSAVVVKGGQTTAVVTVTIHNVTKITSVTVSASLNGSANCNATVCPLFNFIGFDADSVVGGTAIDGIVYLYGRAPNSGLKVSITSSSPSVKPTPSVTIPANFSWEAFSATTTAVSAPITVTITCSALGSKVSGTFKLNPPALSAIAFNPSTITSGSSTVATVTASGPAPSGGISFSLSSDNAAVQTKGTNTIPAGKTSSTVTLQATTVHSNTVANITATSTKFGSAKGKLTINQASFASFTAQEAPGGTNPTATLTLAKAAPAGGLTVGLSSDSAAASVPANLSIAAGQTSITFTVTTKAQPQNSGGANARLTANLGGDTLTTPMKVDEASIKSVTFDVNPVVAGRQSHATVKLTGPTDANGYEFDSTTTGIVAKCKIPAGKDNQQCDVDTSKVSSSGSVNVKWTPGSYSSSLSVVAATITGLTVTHAFEFDPINVTLTLSEALPYDCTYTLATNPTGYYNNGQLTIKKGSQTGSTQLGYLGYFPNNPVNVVANPGNVSQSFTVQRNGADTSWYPMSQVDARGSGLVSQIYIPDQPFSVKQVYQSPVNYRLGKTAVASDSTIYSLHDFSLFALDQNTGAIKWEAQTDGYTNGSACAIDGTIYVGTTAGSVWAFNADGSVKWTHTVSYWRNYATSHLVIGPDGLVYAPWSNPQNSGIDVLGPDGTFLWSWDSDWGIPNTAYSVAINPGSGMVYLYCGMSTGNKLYAIQPPAFTQVGNKVWERDLGAGGPGIAVSSDGLRIYAVDNVDGSVVKCLDPSNGHTLTYWNYVFDGNVSDLVIYPDWSVGVAIGNQFYKFDAGLDTIVGQWDLGGNSVGNPLVDAQGNIFVLTDTGYLVYIQQGQTISRRKLTDMDPNLSTGTCLAFDQLQRLLISTTNGKIVAVRD